MKGGNGSETGKLKPPAGWWDCTDAFPPNAWKSIVGAVVNQAGGRFELNLSPDGRGGGQLRVFAPEGPPPIRKIIIATTNDAATSKPEGE